MDIRSKVKYGLKGTARCGRHLKYAGTQAVPCNWILIDSLSPPTPSRTRLAHTAATFLHLGPFGGSAQKKETRKKAGNLMFILMENSHLVFNLNFFYLFPALLAYDEDVGRRNCSPIWLLLLVVRNNFSSCCKGKRPAIGRGKTIFSSALRNVSQFIYFVLFFFSHFN